MAYAAISKPGLHFNTKLTTGTGNSQAVTGLGFQPDLIWGKRRDSTGHHSWFDAVRGITKGIESSTAAAEFTTTDYYSSFDSDGFTIAAGSGGAGNGSSQTAAQWCWKANGQGSANTDGTINTIYTSANTTSGFSIIKYTGTGSNATVGHGLGVAPKMVIVKVLSTNNDWMVGHNGLDLAGGNPWHKYVYLNDASAEADADTFWNDTAPTSSVVSLGTHSYVNYSGRNYIMYAFAEKKGYCKIGNYKGNGNANGAFVYCGFKPAMVMIKFAGSDNWYLKDSKRDVDNPVINNLFPNLNNADNTNAASYADFLSNGFKFRGTDSGLNGNNNAYIYMAIAEEPLVANVGESIPATAR